MEDETTRKENEINEQEEIQQAGNEDNIETEPGAAPEAIPETMPVSGEVFSPEPPNESETPLKATFWRKALPWTIAGVVALVAGFALSFFLLYLPANAGLVQARAELAATQERLAQTEEELQLVQDNLKSMQANLETAQRELADASFNKALAEVQANVAYARLALATKDLLTARQELSAASSNLNILAAMLDDLDTADALEERLQSIRTKLITDSALALEELRILSENLARIEHR